MKAKKENSATKNASTKENDKIQIIVSGALGRAGGTVLSAALEQESVFIPFGIDERARLGQKAAENIPIYPSFSAAERLYAASAETNATDEIKAETFKTACGETTAIVDFSSPRALKNLLLFAEKYRTPLVLAVTGYSKKQQAAIDDAAKRLAVFQSPNFSLGANLLSRLCAIARKILPEKFDAEIIERHRRDKKDVPSGTALSLAETLRNAAKTRGEIVLGRNERNAKRRRGEIRIHALRGGTIAGEHEIVFAGDDETLILKHVAASPKIFALGAIEAAKFLKEKPVGKYGMADLFADKLRDFPE